MVKHKPMSESIDSKSTADHRLAETRMVTFPLPTGSTVRRWAIWAGVALLLCYIAFIIREIWLPLGLALILAMVLSPVIDRMEAKGWKRASATAFSGEQRVRKKGLSG